MDRAGPGAGRDGLTQVEASALAGAAQELGVPPAVRRWRELSAEVKEDLRLGLGGPGVWARQLVCGCPRATRKGRSRALTRRQTLTTQEVSGVIALLEGGEC